jgi:hypothetical protein
MTMIGNKLEFSEHNFNVLQEAYEKLKEQYHERGASMQAAGEVVRSLFMPYLKRISVILRETTPSRVKITKIQDVLDELNKHTPIGG